MITSYRVRIGCHFERRWIICHLNPALSFSNQAASNTTDTSTPYTNFYRYSPHFFYQRGWYHDNRGGGGVSWMALAWTIIGGRGPGRVNARGWRRLGLSTFRENLPDTDTKNRTMPRFGGEIGEGEAGTQKSGRNCYRKSPQMMTGNWVQAESSKGGRALARETAEYAGMRSGVQVRTEDAGEWRVRAKPRWVALCTGRGGGDQVKLEGFNDERLRMRRR